MSPTPERGPARATHAPLIDADCEDIPGGWPRAYYLNDEGKPRFTQWITKRAGEQIFHCESSRTLTAGLRFACSSCAQVMTAGLMWDQQATFEAAGEPERRIDVYDMPVGSPLCYRCLVFALRACPWFSDLANRWGAHVRWARVVSIQDYEEFDEQAVLQFTALGMTRERITTEQVMAEVRAGRLHLGEGNVGLEPLLSREANTQEEYAAWVEYPDTWGQVGPDGQPVLSDREQEQFVAQFVPRGCPVAHG